MNFFNLFGKNEVREAPQPTPQQTYEQSLEHQSYCDIVKKQSDFLKMFFEKYKYNPLSISSVFGAVNLVSNSIARMPWELKHDDKLVENSFIESLFDDSNVTRFVLMKNMVRDAICQGNGFAYIIRDENGKPKTLRYLRPDQVIIYYDEMKDKVLYQVPVLNKRRYIEPINMLHFFLYSKNGVEGLSIFDFAHNVIDLAGYTDKAAHDYFKNGMSVSGILKSAGNLNDKQRDQIRKGWRNTDGSIRILEGSLDYQQVQSTSKEAELAQNRTQNTISFGQFMNISPIMLGILDHTQYGSLESASTEFVVNTLSPIVDNIEEEWNRKLLMKNERAHYYINLNEEVLIRSDKNSMSTYLGNLVRNGIITINEARQKLDLQPLEGYDQIITYYNNNSNNNDNQENAEQEQENV